MSAGAAFGSGQAGANRALVGAQRAVGERRGAGLASFDLLGRDAEQERGLPPRQAERVTNEARAPAGADPLRDQRKRDFQFGAAGRRQVEMNQSTPTARASGNALLEFESVERELDGIRSRHG